MILTVDIGNTTIGFGLVRQGGIVRVVKVETLTDKRRLQQQLRPVFATFARQPLKVAVISSVVPGTTVLVERSIKNLLGLKVIVVGRDITVPIKNRYKTPKQVGQDRLVGSWAALKLYGKPVIVIDLGTAITFDVVSAKEEYLGGIIVPGLRLSAESLFLKTALLPQIAIKAPKGVIGRTTQESMLSGLFYGYGSLCRGLIDLISRHLQGKPKVVMTGGHTRLMRKFISPNVRIIDENIVHKGLALLAKLAD